LFVICVMSPYSLHHFMMFWFFKIATFCLLIFATFTLHRQLAHLCSWICLKAFRGESRTWSSINTWMLVNLTKVNSFYLFLYCAFYSLVDGFALWCLMNSHIRTLVATIVDLIMLSSLILSFFSFANCVVECAFVICFFVPLHIASLP
jgi:hypothetical protein